MNIIRSLTLLLALGLTACGGGSNTPPVASSSASSSSSSSSEGSSSSSSSSQAQVFHLPIGSGINMISGNQAYSVSLDSGENYAPQGLTVNPGYDWTQVSWDTSHGWPVTEIWRSDDNVFATAEKIGETDGYGHQYADTTTSLGSTHYYWARFVGEDGAPGPFSSIAGNESAALLQGTVAFAQAYASADIDPDGYVVAVRANGVGIDKIDLLTGEAVHLFDAPEPLQAIAIGTDGVVVAISGEIKNVLFVEAPWIYRFTSDGELLSDGHAAENFNALAFDASGNLYASVVDNGIRVLTQGPSGSYTQSATLGFNIDNTNLVGDIDISADNELRMMRRQNGSIILQTIDIETGDHIDTAVIMGAGFEAGPLVYR